MLEDLPDLSDKFSKRMPGVDRFSLGGINGLCAVEIGEVRNIHTGVVRLVYALGTENRPDGDYLLALLGTAVKSKTGEGRTLLHTTEVESSDLKEYPLRHNTYETLRTI